MQKNKKAVVKYKHIKNKPIVASIKSVSASGMTRKIDFYITNPTGLECINQEICEVASYKTDKNGHIIVKGCGMDMVFSVLSNFNYAISELIDGKRTQNYSTYFIDANHYQLI